LNTSYLKKYTSSGTIQVAASAYIYKKLQAVAPVDLRLYLKYERKILN
jgi:hypothetical protein